MSDVLKTDNLSTNKEKNELNLEFEDNPFFGTHNYDYVEGTLWYLDKKY